MRLGVIRRLLRCRSAQFLGALIARARTQGFFVREIGAVEHLQDAGTRDRPELTAARAQTPDNALAAIGMGHERPGLYHTSAAFGVRENPIELGTPHVCNAPCRGR